MTKIKFKNIKKQLNLHLTGFGQERCRKQNEITRTRK